MQYHYLLVRFKDDDTFAGPWSVEFGDHNREHVQDELEAYRDDDGVHAVRIVSARDDKALAPILHDMNAALAPDNVDPMREGEPVPALAALPTEEYIAHFCELEETADYVVRRLSEAVRNLARYGGGMTTLDALRSVYRDGASYDSPAARRAAENASEHVYELREARRHADRAADLLRTLELEHLRFTKREAFNPKKPVK